MKPPVTYHRVTDEPGLRRAVCNCGWSATDEYEALKKTVAQHRCGLPSKSPPLLRGGWVSGLSDAKPGE